MERTENAPSDALGRLAGGLLIAESVLIFVYPQVWALGPDALTGGLSASIPIALVISLPPVLVGFALLLRVALAHLYGVVVAAIGAVAFGFILANDPSGPFTALWAMALVTNIIVLGILVGIAAANFLGGRSNESGAEHPLR